MNMKTPICAFILVAFLSWTTTSSCAQNLIDQVCQKTRNPSLCESTLKSDPNSAAADTKGLAHIMCYKSLDYANQTFETVIPQLIRQAKTKVVVDKLQSCNIIYGLLVTEISSAISQLDSGKNDIALTHLGIAANGTDASEKNFSLVPPKMASPLSERDKSLLSLVLIAQDIIRMLAS